MALSNLTHCTNILWQHKQTHVLQKVQDTGTESTVGYQLLSMCHVLLQTSSVYTVKKSTKIIFILSFQHMMHSYMTYTSESDLSSAVQWYSINALSGLAATMGQKVMPIPTLPLIQGTMKHSLQILYIFVYTVVFPEFLARATHTEVAKFKCTFYIFCKCSLSLSHNSPYPTVCVISQHQILAFSAWWKLYFPSKV